MLLLMMLNSVHVIDKEKNVFTSAAFIVCTQITNAALLLLLIPAQEMMTIRFVIKTLVK